MRAIVALLIVGLVAMECEAGRFLCRRKGGCGGDGTAGRFVRYSVRQMPAAAGGCDGGQCQPIDEPDAGQEFVDLPTGVDEAKRSPTPRITINGREVTRDHVRHKLNEPIGGVVPDDLTVPQLVFISHDAATKARIVKDLANEPLKSIVAGKRVKVYDASGRVEGAMVEPYKLNQDARYQTAAAAAYYLEPQGEFKGIVKWAVYGYPWSEQTIQDVRMADPAYDPNKNPGPFRPKPAPAPAPSPDGKPQPEPATPPHLLSDLTKGHAICGVLGLALLGLLILKPATTARS